MKVLTLAPPFLYFEKKLFEEKYGSSSCFPGDQEKSICDDRPSMHVQTSPFVDGLPVTQSPIGAPIMGRVESVAFACAILKDSRSTCMA